MSAAARSGLDWWGRGIAGCLLGCLFALGLSGAFAEFGPGEIGPPTPQAAITIWLVVPVWATIFAAAFLFRSAGKAWLVLGAANLIVWAPHFLSAIRW